MFTTPPGRSLHATVAVSVLVLIVASGGIALAGGGSGKAIHGCMQPTIGELSLLVPAGLRRHRPEPDRAQGAPGPLGTPGPTGPAGPSDVYGTGADQGPHLSGAFNHTDVASLELPVGAYLISGRANLNNKDGDEQFASCKLSATGPGARSAEAQLQHGHVRKRGRHWSFSGQDTAQFGSSAVGSRSEPSTRKERSHAPTSSPHRSADRPCPLPRDPR